MWNDCILYSTEVLWKNKQTKRVQSLTVITRFVFKKKKSGHMHSRDFLACCTRPVIGQWRVGWQFCKNWIEFTYSSLHAIAQCTLTGLVQQSKKSRWKWDLKSRMSFAQLDVDSSFRCHMCRLEFKTLLPPANKTTKDLGLHTPS